MPSDVQASDCSQSENEPEQVPKHPYYQQNQRARLAIDFPMDWACISHASDVLGMCVTTTSATTYRD
jgi:hypothetical protein